MRNFTYKISFIVIMLITLTSCKKFLEKEPIGKIGKELLFEDVNGAEIALNGSYFQMLNYYKAEFGMYADVASDNVIYRLTSSPQMVNPYNFQNTPEDEALAVGHIWLGIFEALNGINNIINALPTLKTSFPNQISKIDSVNGQALVLRALCHLDLSKVYAQPYNFTPGATHLGVPVLLKTPAPGEQIPRKTLKETYDQIILDINTALPLLKKYNNTNQSVVSYQAALALLSRIYLYQENWEQCVANADLVINDNSFVLATAANYKSVFVDYSNPLSKPKIETLFQLKATRYKSTDISGVFSDQTAGQYPASNKLLQSYTDDDIRKTQMFTITSTHSFSKKYGDGVASASSPLTVKVIRLSEVYLNRAEAKWHLKRYQEAADDIKIIAQRAHPTINVQIGDLSPEVLYQIIASERNMELAFEGHRLYDIVRRGEDLVRGTDCNATTCKLNYPNDKFALPISRKELDANKAMQQNPGYN